MKICAFIKVIIVYNKYIKLDDHYNYHQNELYNRDYTYYHI